ncbi:MAG: hypothetical protein V3R49_00575 [Gammaproteobacteria bacterium]
MKPVLTVQFSAKAGDYEFKEESVTFNKHEEFFEFVAPGGGCENIPNEVEEIRIIFLSPEHPNTQNPIGDAHAMLQLHMVIITGPLSEIVQTGGGILDKAWRGELSQSFLSVIGEGHQ